MFDGHGRQQLKDARPYGMKLEGHALTYRQQIDDGRWER